MGVDEREEEAMDMDRWKEVLAWRDHGFDAGLFVWTLAIHRPSTRDTGTHPSCIRVPAGLATAATSDDRTRLMACHSFLSGRAVFLHVA